MDLASFGVKWALTSGRESEGNHWNLSWPPPPVTLSPLCLWPMRKGACEVAKAIFRLDRGPSFLCPFNMYSSKLWGFRIVFNVYSKDLGLLSMCSKDQYSVLFSELRVTGLVCHTSKTFLHVLLQIKVYKKKHQLESQNAGLEVNGLTTNISVCKCLNFSKDKRKLGLACFINLAPPRGTRGTHFTWVDYAMCQFFHSLSPGHSFTARPVMMTSQIPKELKSAAAGGVSSVSFSPPSCSPSSSPNSFPFSFSYRGTLNTKCSLEYVWIFLPTI